MDAAAGPPSPGYLPEARWPATEVVVPVALRVVVVVISFVCAVSPQKVPKFGGPVAIVVLLVEKCNSSLKRGQTEEFPSTFTS
jgi:hypothetical protein